MNKGCLIFLFVIVLAVIIGGKKLITGIVDFIDNTVTTIGNIVHYTGVAVLVIAIVVGLIVFIKQIIDGE